MNEIYLIPGIHSKDKWPNSHKVFSYFFQLRGIKTHNMYYGYLLGIMARFKNPGIAEDLYDKIPDGADVLGHSNGCTLIYKLAQMGKKFGTVILIQPALDADKEIVNAGHVHVYYNEKDLAVTFSKIFMFHAWGAQGHSGPSFSKENYKTFDTINTVGMPAAKGHMWHSTDAVYDWGPFVVSRYLEEKA